MKPRKTLEKILAGSRNIRFADMQALVVAYGFHLSESVEATTSTPGQEFGNWSTSRMSVVKPSRIRFDSSCSSWKNTT